MDKTVALLTASWCPRCPAARQLWKGLRDRYGFELREFDLDSPEGQGLAAHYGLAAVPAVIADGQVVNDVFDEVHAVRLLEGESRN